MKNTTICLALLSSLPTHTTGITAYYQKVKNTLYRYTSRNGLIAAGAAVVGISSLIYWYRNSAQQQDSSTQATLDWSPQFTHTITTKSNSQLSDANTQTGPQRDAQLTASDYFTTSIDAVIHQDSGTQKDPTANTTINKQSQPAPKLTTSNVFVFSVKGKDNLKKLTSDVNDISGYDFLDDVGLATVNDLLNRIRLQLEYNMEAQKYCTHSLNDFIKDISATYTSNLKRIVKHNKNFNLEDVYSYLGLHNNQHGFDTNNQTIQHIIDKKIKSNKNNVAAQWTLRQIKYFFANSLSKKCFDAYLKDTVDIPQGERSYVNTYSLLSKNPDKDLRKLQNEFLQLNNLKFILEDKKATLIDDQKKEMKQ